ncbi:unnamed protein product, partial [Polarella glacialis]
MWTKRWPPQHLRLSCCAVVCGALCRGAQRSLEALAVVPCFAHNPVARRSLHTATSSSSRAAVGLSREGGGERAHVLAIATEYRQEAVILQRSAQLLGYSFHFCGMREKWIGWGTKLVQYRRALKRGLKRGDIAATDPVLLIDGWDCAIVGPALEFSQKMASSPFADLDVPWYAGERICGPDFFKATRIDAVHGDPGTPWRYPNAGCMAGRALGVLNLIDDLLKGARNGEEPFPEDGNDQ